MAETSCGVWLHLFRAADFVFVIKSGENRKKKFKKKKKKNDSSVPLWLSFDTGMQF
jgi:hypothetical protein